MEIDEQTINIKMKGDKSINWFLDLDSVSTQELPFINIDTNNYLCRVSK